MARKIGDVAIGIVFLVFMIVGLNYLFTSFDDVMGLNNTYINKSFTDIEATVSSSNDLESNFVSSTDTIAEQDITTSELEVRGAGASSLLNRDSQNIVIAFFGELESQFPIMSTIIISLVVSLFLITVTILVLRFFWGDTRV